MAVTPKGERTRQHIIDVAMARFESDGFAETSMRTIAAEAGISLGLAYRYFDTKEGIVAAFYQDVARKLSEHPIEGSTLGERFRSVMRAKVALLAPRKRAMGALMAAMLDPDGPVGILSPATAEIRTHTRAAMRRTVEGAAGVPPDLREPLAQIAWTGHLLLLLAWIQRPEEAEKLVERIASALDLAAPFLGMPIARGLIAQIASALAAFGGTEAAPPPG